MLLMERSVPVRSCVICKRREEKEALVRFVLVEDGCAKRVEIDPLKRMQGRGSYSHLECLLHKNAMKSLLGAFRRREKLANVVEESLVGIVERAAKISGESDWGLRLGETHRALMENRKNLSRIRL